MFQNEGNLVNLYYIGITYEIIKQSPENLKYN
jgi:hypothetical protein